MPSALEKCLLYGHVIHVLMERNYSLDGRNIAAIVVVVVDVVVVASPACCCYTADRLNRLPIASWLDFFLTLHLQIFDAIQKTGLNERTRISYRQQIYVAATNNNDSSW